MMDLEEARKYSELMVQIAKDGFVCQNARDHLKGGALYIRQLIYEIEKKDS
jgi:hypothetical protein